MQTLIHYTLHLVAPYGLAWVIFGKERCLHAYVIMILTMLVDLDHLFATPIFDPNRMSIGFHPLHTLLPIVCYIIMCILPYQRLGWAWWWRAVGVGLSFHMFTDWQDYILWH